MKKTLLLILATTFILILLSGCVTNTESETSNGQEMTTRSFNYGGFGKIEVASAFEVKITQGDAFSINVTAGDFSRIKVEKDGDTLRVSQQGIRWFAPAHQKPVACITVPDMDSLKLSGASKGTLSNFHTNSNLVLRASGSSYLNTIDISATNVFVEISGSSRLQGNLKAVSDAVIAVSGSSIVELTGEATDISTRVSGASRCNLINFPVCNADINVSGASNAWTNLNGSLKASVSGASNLTYLGNPAPVEIETSGGSYICMHHTAHSESQSVVP